MWLNISLVTTSLALSNLVAIRHMWRQAIEMWKSFSEVEKSIKLLLLHHISLKYGNSKNSVATKVANVGQEHFGWTTLN
jgi:hypothetical protein